MRSTPSFGIAELATAPVLSRPPPILAIDKLQVSLFTRRGVLPAVDGLSLEVASGGTVAIVGESRCGKSLAAFAVMRLFSEPPAKIIGGGPRLLRRARSCPSGHQ